MQNYDFLAIGDMTTDAFIILQEAEVHCDISQEKCQICMSFGDKIPYKDSIIVPAVGNSANAAVSASRLGLKSALVSFVGNDENGTENIETLKQESVGTEFIKTETGKHSNYHYVLLYNAERTILVKHEDFTYSLPDIGQPKWIYLSSLGKNTAAFHQEISNYIADNPDIKLAFQPGTFQINMGPELLSSLYKQTHILFLNVEEAKKVLGLEPKADSKKEEVKVLLQELKNKGPRIVAITDGPRGAYTYDGENFLFMPPYPDIAPPINRTGAGDAFSSTVVSALALDLPLQTALEWGPVNSMSVVQQIGARAGLLKREDLEKYLAERPTNYKAETI